MTKPIRVWMTPANPNPWKVVLVLEELNIPYEIVSFKFDEIKKEPFITLNPNSSVPVIEDPNTDLVLSQSGAIITYIIDQYDINKVLTYDDLKQKNLLNQWLHFQMSVQGPFIHQAGWFNVHHAERLPSVIDRYDTEARRILSVLNGVLEGKEWLVGDKVTYADLAFAPWNDRLDSCLALPAEKKFMEFHNVKAWHERVTSRPSWKNTMARRDELMNGMGLTWNGLPKGIPSHAEYLRRIDAGEDTSPTE